MLFTSLNFFVLVIITFALYYLSHRNQKLQIVILIFASFVFYAWEYPVLLLLLIGSILINVITSFLVARSTNHFQRKAYAISGVGLNLLILAFFKYSPLIGQTFFVDNSSLETFLISIPLPIGISFFTFQGISLVVDVFRGNQVKLYRNLVDRSFGKHLVNTTLFVSLFPQLVAGPIVKAHDFLPQIKRKTLGEIDWNFCFQNVVIGYFLKMVVADNLKDYTFWIAFPYFQTKSSFTLITMLFGYSMQIFADFAGYSLIAIGISALFGYRLNDNFMFPYISTSFSEFWRRWHISLSSFLKEYLYISLGGNRHGKFRTYFNLLMTMVLGGLWHGAAWSYAVWGTYHGLALAMERLFRDKFGKPDHYLYTFFKGVWVFLVVTVGWLLFKLPEFSHVILYLNNVFHNANLPEDYNVILFTFLYSTPVIIYHGIYLWKQHYHIRIINQLKPALLGLLLFFIFTNSGGSGSFIYFQF